MSLGIISLEACCFANFFALFKILSKTSHYAMPKACVKMVEFIFSEADLMNSLSFC